METLSLWANSLFAHAPPQCQSDQLIADDLLLCRKASHLPRADSHVPMCRMRDRWDVASVALSRALPFSSHVAIPKVNKPMFQPFITFAYIHSLVFHVACFADYSQRSTLVLHVNASLRPAEEALIWRLLCPMYVGCLKYSMDM